MLPFIGGDERSKAESNHKDLMEAFTQIDYSANQHKDQAVLASQHQAFVEEVQETASSLDRQVADIKGGGHQGELSAPQLILSSPVGLALSSPKSNHFVSGENIAITAKNNISLAGGQSLIASALRRVSLFAHKAGMKLFAGRGKVEIQAQSDDLEITADKNLKIVTAKGQVHISSPREILLTAGGSYLKINAAGVESGTNGQFIAYAASHSFVGPNNLPYLKPTLPKADLELGELPSVLKFTLLKAPGHPPLANEKYAIFLNGSKIIEDYTDENGSLSFDFDPEETEYEIEFLGNHRFKLNIKEAYSEGVEGEREKLIRSGFHSFVDTKDLSAKDFIIKGWESLFGRKYDDKE